MMVNAPGDLIRRLETDPALPGGEGERFVGYGIMGLPFTSGHVLALRRFPVSPIGPGYTSVWHRDPRRDWVFYADVAPNQSCSRYFSNALSRSERQEISLTWTDPLTLKIEVPAVELVWDVRLAATPATTLLNGIAAAMPAPLWQWQTTLAVMAKVADWALDVGQLRLFGCTPNEQQYHANPQKLWMIEESSARIGDVDLGMPGPLTPQAHVGDFLLPQRGFFMIGSSSFQRCGEHLLALTGSALP